MLNIHATSLLLLLLFQLLFSSSLDLSSFRLQLSKLILLNLNLFGILSCNRKATQPLSFLINCLCF